MAKQHRGKSLARLASRGRGICPVCYATRIKLLYTRKKQDGTALKICKKCSNADQARIEAAELITQPIAYRRKHRKAFYARQAI